MKARCKFTCLHIESLRNQYGISYKLTFGAVTNDKTEENKSFWDATPNGQLIFHCVKEDVAKQFIPGNNYYLDLTLATMP